jgi:hypothetical protein
MQMPTYPREIDLISHRHEGRPDVDDYYPQIEQAVHRDPFEKNPRAVRFASATAGFAQS